MKIKEFIKGNTDIDVYDNVCEELAIAFQHEIDHLDGILFYDRIDPKHKFYTEQEMRLI